MTPLSKMIADWRLQPMGRKVRLLRDNLVSSSQECRKLQELENVVSRYCSMARESRQPGNC